MLVWVGSTRHVGTQVLFMDRDGVLNVDSPSYVRKWSELEFYPDALKALRQFRSRNISVVLISNQSGLHRGIIAWADFWFMHHKMVETIRDTGGDLLAALYCPHRPDEHCTCRKPAPGLLFAASRLYRIPLETTFFIGDRITDIQAAVAAGSRPILLDRLATDDDQHSELDPPAPVARISSLDTMVTILEGQIPQGASRQY
jgi:D-glycero-D-manno-heptose 1,7-bisphosphate phosphatase